jgi:hypothetical protein
MACLPVSVTAPFLEVLIELVTPGATLLTTTLQTTFPPSLFRSTCPSVLTPSHTKHTSTCPSCASLVTWLKNRLVARDSHGLAVGAGVDRRRLLVGGGEDGVMEVLRVGARRGTDTRVGARSVRELGVGCIVDGLVAWEVFIDGFKGFSYEELVAFRAWLAFYRRDKGVWGMVGLLRTAVVRASAPASSAEALAAIERHLGAKEMAKAPTMKELLGITEAEVFMASQESVLEMSKMADSFIALTPCRENLKIRQATLPAEDISIANSLAHLATAIIAVEDSFEEPIELLKEALKIQKATLPPGHKDVAATLRNIGVLSIGQGRFSEGLGMLEQALSALQAAHPPKHPDVLKTKKAIADAQKLQQEEELAAKFLEELEATTDKLTKANPNKKKRARART